MDDIFSEEDAIFSEEDIIEAIQVAVRSLHENDKKLIVDKCSERAQVHYLAIYFDQAIRRIFQEKCQSVQGFPYKSVREFPYKVDVEYNRIGDTKLPKVLYDYCSGCSEGCDCDKKKKRHNVTIDMVFHVRGSKDLQDNVFCLEVKPQQHPKSICDQQRIETLVKGKNVENPHYCYGLALHILNGNDGRLAEGYFYSKDKPEPQKLDFKAR